MKGKMYKCKNTYLWKYIEDSNSLNGSPAKNDLTAVTHGSNNSLLATKWMIYWEQKAKKIWINDLKFQKQIYML